MAKKRKRNILNPSGYTPAEVRKLHRQGFAVRGYIPGAPDALQPRLTSHIRKTALKTMQTAYGPAERALTGREAQAKAIMDKRSRDHQAFQQWMVTQQASLRAERDSQDAQLRATIQQHQTEAKNAMTSLTQQAQANMAAAGIQGTLDQSGTLSAAMQGDIARNAAQATATTQGMKTGSDLLAANQANSMAFAKAAEAKDFARSLQELADVAEAGTKLKLQKGADVAKEISHLLDQEIAKAQQNAQMQIAGQKLGVQMAGIRQRDAANRRTTGAAKRGQDLQFDLGLKRIAMDADKLAETQRHNRRSEKNARDKLKATDPKAASKQERAERTKAIRAVNRMNRYMIDQMGSYKSAKKNKKKEDFNEVVQTLREQYPNDADLIIVAYDLWRFNHLRGKSKQIWKGQYGYQTPAGW